MLVAEESMRQTKSDARNRLSDGPKRICWAFCALALGITPTLASASVGASLLEVRRALSEGHFAYPLAHPHDQRSVLSLIGSIDAGHKRYVIVYYNFEESFREANERVPGGFPHASYRLLLLERMGPKLRYVGHYSMPIGERPKVIGNKIIFDCPAGEGNFIAIHEDGPPSHVQLCGETPLFDRGPW
jgi:hypothetical protein